MCRKIRLRARLAGAILAALGLALVSASCAKQPIKVGVSLVLSGLSSRIGVTGRNGIELAASELNSAGGVKGRQIELLIQDDGDEPAKAKATDIELLSKGAQVLIGHMSSRSGMEAIPYCNERGVVLISPTISSMDWSAKDDFFFRPIAANEYQGKALAAHARAAGLKKAVVYYEYSNRAYTLAVAESFSAEFRAGGGTAEAPLSFTQAPDLDHRAIAAAMIASGADMALSAASAYDNAMISQELAKAGSSLPLYAGMWSMTDDLLRHGGKAVERMVVAGTMDLENDSELFQAFRRSYVARFGEEPSFASAFGYESMMLLGRALEKARRNSSPEIKEALLALGTIDSIQGPLTLDRYGDCVRPYLCFRPKDGGFCIASGAP